MCVPSFLAAMRDPAVFPCPEEFRPARWEDPASLAAHLAWGSGLHGCIGRDLSWATINLR